MGNGKTTKFVVVLFLLILRGVGWLGWQVYSTYQIANRVIDRDSRLCDHDVPAKSRPD